MFYLGIEPYADFIEIIECLAVNYFSIIFEKQYLSGVVFEDSPLLELAYRLAGLWHISHQNNFALA